MSFVENLDPKPLWRHFDRILTIPRGSGSEEEMRRYVLEVAAALDLESRVDEAGNVVVKKPATPGHEQSPITILQSHLDMVNDKNADVEHDFDRDPIRPREEDGYLTATGTTLGSDNGIGVAAMLALMESDDLQHGPLELLFTIDEETGLTGASNLDTGLLEGKRLINLDSEEEGSLCVGCAGGGDSSLTLPLESSAVEAGGTALDVRITGLKGGHSGVDIHLQRGNATQLLARALYAAYLEVPFRLASLRGGNKHNAIPREAFAELTLREEDRQKFIDILNRELEAVRDEFAPAEPNLQWSVDGAELPEEAWDAPTTERVLYLIVTLPHGVMAMSYEIPGLVETSTNLAVVRPDGDRLTVLMSSRSSVASALTSLRRRIRAVGSLVGAEVEEEEGYPGWKPDLDSELLKVISSVHERELGSAPEVGAIHAGLECGLIGEMIPGMDMISLGPQIEFPHSPDERVKIDSVGRFYRLLTRSLEELSAA